MMMTQNKIQLIQQLVEAKVTGAAMGSQEFSFQAFGKVAGGKYECGGKTASSIGLML